jgi:Fe-S-cluster containining protein
MGKKKKKKEKKGTSVPQATPCTPKKQFICQRCGDCCINSTPAFTKEEYKVIRDLKVTRERNIKFTKVNFDAPFKDISSKRILQGYAYFTGNGIKTLNMGVKAAKILGAPPCEFLDRDENGKSSCAIYAHRPSVCRDFGVKEWTCPNNPDYLKR